MVGAYPRIAVWINGTPIATLDAATLRHPGYDAVKVAAVLGREGHIAFEVHDNDPRMGKARWGRHAACQWRKVRVRRSEWPDNPPLHLLVRKAAGYRSRSQNTKAYRVCSDRNPQDSDSTCSPGCRQNGVGPSERTLIRLLI